MRWLKVVLVMAVFAALRVGVIHADDTTPSPVPTFSDGRVNNWQIDEPVAVYCVFDHSQSVNVGVFQRIEAWGLNGNELFEVAPRRSRLRPPTVSWRPTAVTRPAKWQPTPSKSARPTATVSPGVAAAITANFLLSS